MKKKEQESSGTEDSSNDSEDSGDDSSSSDSEDEKTKEDKDETTKEDKDKKVTKEEDNKSNHAVNNNGVAEGKVISDIKNEEQEKNGLNGNESGQKRKSDINESEDLACKKQKL